MNKRIVAALCGLALALCGCPKQSGRVPPTSLGIGGTAPTSSGAWVEVGTFLDHSRYGVNLTNHGFGLGPANELVRAGGQEMQVGTQLNAPSAEVVFAGFATNTTSLRLLRTARLPAGVVRPHVITVAGRLYVFGGFTASGTDTRPNEQVWCYRPATNDFVHVGNDPEPSQDSYAFEVNGSIYRITPPYPSRRPSPNVGSVGVLNGNSWSCQSLTGLIPMDAASCLVDRDVYLFGGKMLVTDALNTHVFKVNLDSGEVTKLGVQVKERLGGVAIYHRGEIHIIGGGVGLGGTTVPATPESFDIASQQVRDRPDLEPFFYFGGGQVSGDFVYMFDPRNQSWSVFRYRPR